MKTNNRLRTLKGKLVATMALPVMVLLTVFTIAIVFSMLYVHTGETIFSILFFSFIFSGTVAYIFIANSTYRKLYHSQYDSFYKVTRNNYKIFLEGGYKYEKYPETDVDEIVALNQNLSLIESRYKSGYIVTTVPRYANLSLEYVNKPLNLVTSESFERELHNIIMLSQSYRNVLIDVSFSVDIGTLSEDDRLYLIKVFTELFSDYIGVLFAYRHKQNSLLIYLPVIDSLSRVEEQVISVIRDSSLTIRDFEGLKYVGAKFAIVAYPYSGVDELLSDLRYAKRQGKIVNFYLPHRIQDNIGKSLMLSDAMNINYMSSLLDRISTLDYEESTADKDIKTINSFFDDVSRYLDIDDIGIIKYYEPLTKFFKIATNKGDNTLFNKKDVDADFVLALSRTTDSDNSYFFSKRNHASNFIGRQLDLYGISSGFYFITRDDQNHIESVIYFFNHNDKEMIIDTYLRESLLVICLRLKHYFEIMRKKNEIDTYRNESEYLMALTNYSLYKIDARNYDIKYYSKDLKTMFPSLEINKPCYKVLFGLEKPCQDCPLKTLKKKEFTHRKAEFESSLILNDQKGAIRSILIEMTKEGDLTGDLFNKDYLINSYLSLYQNIRNSYYVSGRGYVVLLSVDNIDQLIEKQGSEGTLFAIRNFIARLKKILKTDEFYSFNNNTIALLLPGVGHVDVINACEKIYEASKVSLFDDGTGEDILHLTYMPTRWPNAFATAEDFMKHINDFYYHGEHERNKDFIYFYDPKISRSASKRAFIVSVIEQEFSGSFSSVNLQPIINAKDKRIIGAEILLRINNVYSNAVFNAEEISQIAEQEGKTGLITEAIINFIGNMYKEYGNSVFKINNFERIAINVDSTYLKDLSLLSGVVKLHDEYKFPNNFLSFEIPEEIIPTHTNEIQKMARELASVHIMFSVDRYTGRYIGCDKLKELGFKEVKIARDLVYKVDTDGIKFNEVKDIVKAAKENGLSIGVVGVENSAQFSILKEFDEDMKMQGYHFYKPLSRADFISALISHNREY